MERGIAGLPKSFAEGSSGGLLLPAGGVYAFIHPSSNSTNIGTKDTEYVQGHLMEAQSIRELAFRVTNAPDAGAIVRLGIRQDVGGAIGPPVVDIPVTVTGSAWNSVIVDYRHPGGPMWVSFTNQNWVTTGPSLDYAVTQPHLALPTAAARVSIDWNAGHVVVVATQAITAGESLPSKFVNANQSTRYPYTLVGKRAG